MAILAGLFSRLDKMELERQLPKGAVNQPRLFFIAPQSGWCRTQSGAGF
jgi:hypothetical protein